MLSPIPSKGNPPTARLAIRQASTEDPVSQVTSALAFKRRLHSNPKNIFVRDPEIINFGSLDGHGGPKTTPKGGARSAQPFGVVAGAPGKESKSVLRPAFGQPEARFRYFPGGGPAKMRPGRPTYGPETPLRNIEHSRASDLVLLLLSVMVTGPLSMVALSKG